MERLLGPAVAALLAGCTAALSPEELADPERCKTCHPEHYRQWSGSAHAYATDDPLFLAMQTRGLRETGGALGDQCLGCHAPMALRAQLRVDNASLPAVPRAQRGVTCYVCHVLNGDHRHALVEGELPSLAGGLAGAIETSAHGSAYSDRHDRLATEGSAICEPCHRVTFEEWEGSVFALPDPRTRLSCGRCHMAGTEGVAAEVEGAPLRRIHDHRFVGASLALVDWPERDDQRAEIQRALDPAVLARLCVVPFPDGPAAQVTLDNVSMGHAWPTGSALSRRAWVELVAYRNGAVVFETGRVEDGEAIDGRAEDHQRWVLRTEALGASGEAVHLPWQAASYQTALLPPAVTNDPKDPRFLHSITRLFPAGDQVTLRVRLRPLELTVLDALIASGDLDPAARDRAVTWTLGSTVLEWRSERGYGCVP